jgi:hypothetical protein
MVRKDLAEAKIIKIHLLQPALPRARNLHAGLPPIRILHSLEQLGITFQRSGIGNHLERAV